MKLILSALFITFFIGNIFSQNYKISKSRSLPNPLLAPFYHGVASGDALQDRVIIWTRVTPDSLYSGSITVNWIVSTDTLLSNIVLSGQYTTDDTRDYTVKVDVVGLQPDTWYYYCFEVNNVYSLIGRTRTLPTINASNYRFAVFSGSQYQQGYFNAYRTAAKRNDFDAVMHLGDYIYEMGFTAGDDNPNRMVNPNLELVTLSDYRLRYSHYRLDPDLRYIHQQYPWYLVWDDHETANNSWSGGAGSHDSLTEGSWNQRSNEAIQAYLEWLPIREINPLQPFEIYRKVSIGNLADILFLETRLLARDNQDLPNDDPNKTMLGTTQYNWLINELTQSQATWKIIAQQVVIAPVEIPIYGILNNDQWDGYSVEREKILKYIYDNQIENVVVLTGDIHSAWANNVPYDPPGIFNPAKTVAVEYVTTSVTSTFPMDYFGQETAIQLTNGHVKYLETQHRGYYILDIRGYRCQADWWFVNTTDTISDDEFCDKAMYVNPGMYNSLTNENCSSLTPINTYTFQAPLLPPQITQITFSDYIDIIGIYPNPIQDNCTVQFATQKSANINISVSDINGKSIQVINLGQINQGIYYKRIEFNANVSAGFYFIDFYEANQFVKRFKVVKL